LTLTPDLELASGYFTTRLLAARQASQLPASAQFDLARSPLSDDELEDIVDSFRDTPQPRDGWGIAPMLGEVLSTQPKTIPTKDLAALQRNLIAQGYAAPNQVANGTWDPSWYANLRRFDRDNYERQRAGYHWYSAPVMSGVNALTNTLPSRVFQGIVGAAKGFVLQAPETAERLGLLGGAAAGAAIGGVIGGGVGAVPGAIIGGLVGFAADLFGDDESEHDQTLLQGFLDVLSPWEEYRDQGPRALWEDLGWVLTAASLASGVGTAVKGVQSGVAATRAATLGGEGTFAVGSGGAATTTQSMSLGRALLQPGASKELGVFGTITRAATRKFVPGSLGAVETNLARYSPIAFMNRVGPKMALDVFGGLSQAQMGARLFGGLGQGSKQKFLEAKSALEAELGRELNEDELQELSKKTATSTIEKAIAEAPRLETGIDIPLVGDAADLAAFALYPQRLLPFGGGRSLALSAEGLMGDTSLAPYIAAMIHGTPEGIRTGRAKVREYVTPGADAYMRLDYGIHVEAAQLVQGALRGKGRPATLNEAWRNARAAVIEKLHSLPEEEGRAFAADLIKRSYIDDTDYTRHLLEITAEGSGVDRFGDFLEATRHSLEVEREVAENTRYVYDDAGEIIGARADLPVEPRFDTFQTPEGPIKQRVTSEEVKLGGVARSGRSIDIISVEQQISLLERQIDTMTGQMRRVSVPQKASQIQSIKLLKEAELRSLRRTLSALKKASKKEVRLDRFRIVPARKDHLTRQAAHARKQEYLEAKEALLAAQKSEAPHALDMAAQRHANVIENLKRDGIIDEVTAARANRLNPGKQIEKAIDDYARGAASEVQLPDHLMSRFDELGYKPVTAGDDVLQPDEVGRFVDLDKWDVGDYTKRAAVWETLALSPKFRSDKSLFGVRRASELAELGDSLQRHGIRMTAGQAFRRLQNHIESINHEGAVWGPFIKGKSGSPRLYKVDPRDLTVDDIYKAFEDVPGFTDETARDVYGALRRGAAYGHELRLLKPIESAYAAGQLLRLNGLPGFADLVRTWHLKAPSSFDRAGWAAGKVTYKPRASADKAYDLAHSVQRARAARAISDTAAANRIPDQQRDVAMMMLDSIAESQVKLGRFESVDDFYRLIDADYATKYVSSDALNQPLFQKLQRSEMRELFEAFEEGNADWYQRATAAIQDAIPMGSVTKLPLSDDVVEDHRLFTAILAATSPRTPVKDNFTQAFEVFRLMKNGSTEWGSVSGVMESKWKMLDDIASGNLPETWTEPFRTTQPKFGAKNLAWRRAQDAELEQIPKMFENREVGFGAEAAMDIGRELALKGSKAAPDYIAEKIRRVRDVLDENRLGELGAADQKLVKEFARKGWPAGKKSKQLQDVEDLTEAILERDRERAYNALERIETAVTGVPSQSRSRMKVWSFYQNLMGDLEQVTVDTWMADLYDLPGEGVTPSMYDDVREHVRRLADELTEVRGTRVYPSEVQAALWAGAKHMAVAQGAPKNLLDAASYDVLTGPLKQAFDDFAKKANPNAVFQRVEDEVRGMTAWGPDGLQVMRFFRDADFSTLVHENAHLLRRMLAPEDLRRIEKVMGVTSRPAGYSNAGRAVSAPEAKAIAERGANILSRLRSGNRTRIGAMTDDRVQRLFDAVNADEWGGMTLNVKTGEPMEFSSGFAGGIVPNEKTITISLEEAKDLATFRDAAKRAQRRFAKDLGFDDVGLGVFRDPEKGTVTFEPSLYLRDRDDAEALVTHLRADGGAYDFSTGDGVFPISTEDVLQGGWTRNDEERFAEVAEAYFTKKADPNVVQALDPLKTTLRTLWGQMRHEAVSSNFIPRGMRKELDKLFPIPEQFAPPGLLKSTGRGVANRQTAGGAVLGGIAGAYEGREDGILDGDILHAAALGAAGGLVGRKLARRNYGYLPDSLMRMNTALRYTLSFTFDLGRFTEQNMIAMAKHDLPPMLSPTKYTKGREWKTPYRNGTVTGDEAWRDAVRFWDELNGTTVYASIDDLDRRMYQAGMLGFSPRNWEVAQAFQLFQRGWSSEKIREAVSEIGRYGLGRTAAEKSANFVVFPFSFSKKFLTTLSDFVLQAPGRNLLLHEGMRRYYESEADERFDEILDRYAPLLKDLAAVNNLAFGVSPGRFFLQGLSDHRTNTGKAAQILSSFFVPSGAATSLAQAAGNIGDLAVNAFVPIVVTGESINRAGGINNFFDVFRRYVPFVREVDQYFIGAGDMGGSTFSRQVKALMEGGDPYWQFSRYQEGLKLSKASLQPIAVALGYSTVDGLLQSEQGAVFQAQYEAEKEQLRQELPSGFRMSQTFENDDALNAAALMDLSQKANRSEAEDRILSLFEQLESWKQAISMLGLDTDQAMAVQAAQLRQRGMQFADDARFVELWNRFFLRDFGPIRRVA
jgi:hypothetical protein